MNGDERCKDPSEGGREGGRKEGKRGTYRMGGNRERRGGGEVGGRGGVAGKQWQYALLA